MTDRTPTEQQLFESALMSVPLAAPPVIGIRRGVRRAQERAALLRTASLAFAITVAAVFSPFAGTVRDPVFAAGTALAGQIRALLFPANPDRVFVLGKRAAVYDRVASLAEAQKRLPFRMLVPTAKSWQLRTVLVSEPPAVMMLYRLPNDTWAQITERPRSRAVSDGDRGVMLLLDEQPTARASGISVRPVADVISHRRTMTTDRLQVTIATTGPDAAAALRGALIPL
jgi:hypothetical protein